MKPRRNSLPLLLCMSSSLVVSPHVFAADITLSTSNASGTSGFNSGTGWPGGTAPTSGNNYSTGSLRLRSPATAGTYTFAGDSLYVGGISSPSAGRFLIKSFSTLNANYKLNGGLIDLAPDTGTGTAVLGGTMEVLSSSTIGVTYATTSSTRFLDIQATISGSADLQVGLSSTSTFGGDTVSSSNMTGTLVLSAANTYSGTMSVVGGPGVSNTNGRLQLNNLNALQNATLSLNTTTSSNSPLTFTSSSNTGTYNIGALSSGSNNPNLVLQDTAGSAVAISVGGNNASTTYGGVISGSGSLSKTGTGTLTLSAANSYTGSTNVNAGTLVIAGNQTGNGQIVVNNGSTLQFGDGTSTNGSSPSSGTIFVNNSSTVQINKTDGGTVSNQIASNPSAVTTLSGANASGTTNTFTGVNYSNGGTFVVNSTNAGATLAFSGASPGAIDLKGTALTVNGAGDTLFTSAGTGVYSSTGGGSVDKNGTGTLIYQGDQGYTGTTAINAGAIRVDATQTSSGIYYVGNGGTTTTDASLLLGGGTTGLTGGATLDANVVINPGDGTSRIIGGTNTSGTNTFSGSIAMDGSFGENRSIELTTASGGTVVLSGVVSGAGQNLTKTGDGTAVLSGTNTYSGSTTVSAGTLQVTGSNANTATTVSSGAILASGASGGTVSASLTVNSGGKFAPGGVGTIGSATVNGGLTMNSGSIFCWDLDSPTTGGTSVNAGSYDTVTVNGGFTGSGAVFDINLPSDSFTDAFWDSNQSWTNIFSVGGTYTDLATIFSGGFSGTGISSTGVVTGQGQFSLSGNTLTWTAFSAVPELSTAFAGILLAGGLFTRRRQATR